MDRLLLPEKIQGQKIVLKKNALEHAEEMFQCLDSDRERLRVFLPWVDRTNTLQDEINFIKTSDLFNGKPMRSYGIFLQGKYIGNITAHNIILEQGICELGYWVHSEYEGKGLISDAVSTIERALFSSGFNRIEIHCSEQNSHSARVASRNSYKFVGVIKEKLAGGENEVEMNVYVKHRSK